MLGNNPLGNDSSPFVSRVVLAISFSSSLAKYNLEVLSTRAQCGNRDT